MKINARKDLDPNGKKMGKKKSKILHCTNVENDRFSSGGSRPLGLDALMLMKVLNLFIVLKLHRNLRFLINFEYYLIKNELENA